MRPRDEDDTRRGDLIRCLWAYRRSPRALWEILRTWPYWWRRRHEDEWTGYAPIADVKREHDDRRAGR